MPTEYKEERNNGVDSYFWLVHLLAAIGSIGLVAVLLTKIKEFIRRRPRTPVTHLQVFISAAGDHYHAISDCSGLAGARGIAGKTYCKKCVRT